MVNYGMAYTKDQMTKYISAYRENRRNWATTYLGGRCVKCGQTFDLEFDHVNPATKIKAIASALTDKWEDFVTEVKKCQLLCKTHHVEKTRSQFVSRARHGYQKMYRSGCRCETCVTGQRERRKRHRTLVTPL